MYTHIYAYIYEMHIYIYICICTHIYEMGFPGGSVSKESAHNADSVRN